MSDPLDLDAIRAAVDARRDVGRTHWDGCEVDPRHRDCAIRALLAEVDALRAAKLELLDAWDDENERRHEAEELAAELRTALAAQTALEALIATWRAENPTSMAGIYATGYEDALRRCADDLEYVAAQTAPQEEADCQHDYAEYVACRRCGQTEAAIEGCHHCDEAKPGTRCWWCLRLQAAQTAPVAPPTPNKENRDGDTEHRRGTTDRPNPDGDTRAHQARTAAAGKSPLQPGVVEGAGDSDGEDEVIRVALEDLNLHCTDHAPDPDCEGCRVQLQGLSVRAAAAPPAVAPPTPEASETFGPWLRRQVAAAHTAYLAAPKTNKARAWDAYVLMSGVEAEYSQRAAAAPPAVAPPTPEETDPLKWLVARGIWFTDSRGPISQAKYEELRVALMEQVIAIVAAAAPPQGWQPIATAPKDGLLVLLTGENHVVLSGFYGDGRWQQDGTGHTVYGPQFWMPLPAPPEEQP